MLLSSFLHLYRSQKLSYLPIAKQVQLELLAFRIAASHIRITFVMLSCYTIFRFPHYTFSPRPVTIVNVRRISKMECKTEIVDVRKTPAEETEKRKVVDSLVWELNHTQPRTEEYFKIQKELFQENIGENSIVVAPLQGVCFDRIKIGNNVFVNSNLLAMARGGITIEDNVQIAANVQLITNNHDMYDRMVLLCKPVIIRKGAWIGAGASILPGVEVGKHAIVGAAAVVTKDVPDYAVVVGNPARVIKTLDPSKFAD